jgi:prepilin-type N-terminal cleavage/methylation domain-containing protein
MYLQGIQSPIPTIFEVRLSAFLMKHKPSARSGWQAFTLIELVFAVAIVGLLAVLVVPQYLRYRSRAEAAAVIGAGIAVAKDCATWQISRSSHVVTNPSTGEEVLCDGSVNPQIIDVSWQGDATGVRCLNAEVTDPTHRSARFPIVLEGAINCTIPAI